MALASCFQQAGAITDIGVTPYYLIRPVLKRLNAKQLALLEENSPNITPESDELWAILIEKDFADRPMGSRRNLLGDGNSRMPNKDLYMQYALDRERFLESSAHRLRRITEKLQREKSRNSIVPIQGIIAEPVMRRRTFEGPRPVRPASKYNNNSIMGKAYKDVQNRLLMFGGSKPSDSFSVFQNARTTASKAMSFQKNLGQRPFNSLSKKHVQRPWTHSLSLKTSQVPALVKTTVAHSTMSQTNLRDLSKTSPESQSSRDIQEMTSLRETRKRKPQSPLLDSRRRPQRPKRVTLPQNGNSVAYKVGVDHQNQGEPLVDSSSCIKAIKSSIFY